MKRILRKPFVQLILGTIFLYGATLNAQLNLPQGSQMAKVTQRIGISDIAITYSRPSVNNRQIWGQLVPYGMNNLGFGTATSSPWRAGANENTVIEFPVDVKVEGKDLKAGKYGLHMVINENNTASIIFSNNHTAWGSYFYDQSEDELRVEVQTKEIPHTEQLTYVFNEVGASSAIVALNWEKKQIPFTVEMDVPNIVLADIRKKLQDAPGFNRQTWEQAASYSLNNGGDLNEAMGWIENAIAGQFYSQKTFANLAIKSQIFQKMNRKEDALSLVDEMATMANTNQLNAIGYQLLGMGEYDKAIKYFKLNVKNNPQNANVFDSLGEAYKTIGDKKNAIKNLKKALSLNPGPGVKANSEKLLAELGVTN